MDGAEAAIGLGLPLNRFITIDWELAGVADPVKAVGSLLKFISDALRKKGCKTAYVWVQEWGSTVGQHAHILLHMPPDLRRWFNRMLDKWLKACGVPRRDSLRKSGPIGASYSAAFGDEVSRDNYRQNLLVLTRYLLKDVEPNGRAALGIVHAGSFGLVRGKRSGVSQHLRAASRRC